MYPELCRATLITLLAAALTASGCAPKQPGDALAVGPEKTHPPKSLHAYINEAAQATGGRSVWKETSRIEFQSVATFYRTDGTYYLTEQQYLLYPWSNAVRLSVVEPSGSFVWLLEGDEFTIETSTSGKEAPVHIGTLTDIKELMYAVRAVSIAPAQLLTKPEKFIRENKPVKIKGSWSYPIEYLYPLKRELKPVKPDWFEAVFLGAKPVMPPKPYWSKAIFYQNKTSSRIEIIRLVPPFGETISSGRQFPRRAVAVRGYDYSEAESLTAPGIARETVLIPTKIELFTSQQPGVLGNKLVKIDVKR